MRRVLILTGLILVLVGAQLQSNTYQAEFGAYPDEPGHYITGLMFTEYLRQGLPGSPTSFVQDFYLHYPKVAIGNWPPLFYILIALWSLVFGSSKVSVFVLLAILNATTAWLIWWCARSLFSPQTSLWLALWYTLLPLTHYSNNVLLSDGVVALLSFISILAFARYWSSNRYLDGIWFGLAVSATILTKGSGVALILLPPLAILATRQWHRLFHGPLLVAGLLVLALGGSWTYLTLGVAQDGWNHDIPLSHYLADGLQSSPRFYLISLTPVLALAVAGGLLQLALRPAARKPLYLHLLLSIAAIVLFHVFVPVGIEPRRYLMAVPSSLILAGCFLTFVTERLPRYWNWAPGLAITAALAFVSLPPAPKQHYGFDRVAETLLSRPEWSNCAALISSSIDAEGMLISEVALRQSRPQRYLLRATKLLASMKWSGSDYHSRFQTAAEMQTALDAMGARLLVVGPYPTHRQKRQHHLLLDDVLSQHQLWGDPIPVASTGVSIYRRRDLACPAKPSFVIDFGTRSNITLKP
ncbi:MAG: glycosyltransferase family 39 protein [Bryobacterales bacterium]|nr:glycosyltransferase family 39 protein [Bryobacterales bacterium]